MKCAWPVCENEVVVKFHKNKKYCSKNCVLKAAVSKRRRLLKKLAVEFLGGKCSKCNYDKCIQALHFHHKDKREKDFGIAAHGRTKGWEQVKKELEKCVLICANCHAEEHAKEIVI